MAFIFKMAFDGSMMTSVDELNNISKITFDDGVDGDGVLGLLLAWLAANFCISLKVFFRYAWKCVLKTGSAWLVICFLIWKRLSTKF